MAHGWLLAAALAALAALSTAQVYYSSDAVVWSEPKSGNWTNAVNWVQHHVPCPDDHVQLPSSVSADEYYVSVTANVSATSIRFKGKGTLIRLTPDSGLRIRRAVNESESQTSDLPDEPCRTVENVVVTVIAATTIRVAWDPVEDAAFTVKADDGKGNVVMATAETNQVWLSGLEVNSPYTVTVVATDQQDQILAKQVVSFATPEPVSRVDGDDQMWHEVETWDTQPWRIPCAQDHVMLPEDTTNYTVALTTPSQSARSVTFRRSEAASASGNFIGLRFVLGTNASVSFVSNDRAPTVCATPTNVVVSVVTPRLASVSWTAVAGAQSYSVHLQDKTSGSSGMHTSETTSILLDLVTSHSYTVRVAANSTTLSPWSESVAFASPSFVPWREPVDDAWTVPTRWEPKRLPCPTEHALLPSSEQNYSVTLAETEYVRSITFRKGSHLAVRKNGDLRIVSVDRARTLALAETSQCTTIAGRPVVSKLVAIMARPGTIGVYWIPPENVDAKFDVYVAALDGSDFEPITVRVDEGPAYVKVPQGHKYSVRVLTLPNDARVGAWSPTVEIDVPVAALWKAPVTGQWNNGSRWLAGTVPLSTEHACLPAANETDAKFYVYSNNNTIRGVSFKGSGGYVRIRPGSRLSFSKVNNSLLQDIVDVGVVPVTTPAPTTSTTSTTATTSTTSTATTTTASTATVTSTRTTTATSTTFATETLAPGVTTATTTTRTTTTTTTTTTATTTTTTTKAATGGGTSFGCTVVIQGIFPDQLQQTHLRTAMVNAINKKVGANVVTAAGITFGAITSGSVHAETTITTQSQANKVYCALFDMNSIDRITGELKTIDSKNYENVTSSKVTQLSQCSSCESCSLTETNTGGSSSPIAAIAGAAIAVIILVILIAIYLRRKRKPDHAGRLKVPAIAEYAMNPLAVEGKFDTSRLTVGESLGNGHYGRVKKGALRDGHLNAAPTPVAVWQLRPNAQANLTRRFVEEVECMQQLSGQHQSALQIYGSELHRPVKFVVMELADLGTLLSFLRDNRGTKTYAQGVSLSEMVDFATQVCEGLHFLETQRLVHGSLCCKHVLLTTNRTCKLTGIGRAADLDVLAPWTAPEVAQGRARSGKSDVWAWAVTTWEILTLGATPFPGMASQGILAAVERGQRLPRPDSTPSDLWRLLNACWEQSPLNRPNFGTLAHGCRELNIKDVTPSDPQYLPVEDRPRERSASQSSNVIGWDSALYDVGMPSNSGSAWDSATYDVGPSSVNSSSWDAQAYDVGPGQGRQVTYDSVGDKGPRSERLLSQNKSTPAGYLYEDASALQGGGSKPTYAYADGDSVGFKGGATGYLYEDTGSRASVSSTSFGYANSDEARRGSASLPGGYEVPMAGGRPLGYKATLRRDEQYDMIPPDNAVAYDVPTAGGALGYAPTLRRGDAYAVQAGDHSVYEQPEMLDNAYVNSGGFSVPMGDDEA